jgi:hypothetical protein
VLCPYGDMMAGRVQAAPNGNITTGTLKLCPYANMALGTFKSGENSQEDTQARKFRAAETFRATSRGSSSRFTPMDRCPF